MKTITVTLNGRLDYFGTTVNVAARLQGLSQGGDIVISSAVGNDPEVVEMINHANDSIALEPLEARLRGLEEEQFQLWRLKPNFELIS